MRINVVFNLEGTEELKTVSEALNHVASLNDKIRLQKQIENLVQRKTLLVTEKATLIKELEVLRQLYPERKDVKAVMKEACKTATPVSPERSNSIQRNVVNTTIRR